VRSTHQEFNRNAGRARIDTARLLEPFEHVAEDVCPPHDSNIELTVVAGNEPSEVSSSLASPIPESTAGKNHTPDSNRVLPPWTIRTVSLLGFIAFLVTLLAVLEVLYRVSNRYQGLATSTKSTYYLWKYCPTASKSPLGNGKLMI
jgi:hypothetical protein